MMALGRILVVDDEAQVREVLTEYFATAGYAVEAATNGLEIATARVGSIPVTVFRPESAGRRRPRARLVLPWVGGAGASA